MLKTLNIFCCQIVFLYIFNIYNVILSRIRYKRDFSLWRKEYCEFDVQIVLLLVGNILYFIIMNICETTSKYIFIDLEFRKYLILFFIVNLNQMSMVLLIKTLYIQTSDQLSPSAVFHFKCLKLKPFCLNLCLKADLLRFHQSFQQIKWIITLSKMLFAKKMVETRYDWRNYSLDTIFLHDCRIDS